MWTQCGRRTARAGLPPPLDFQPSPSGATGPTVPRRVPRTALPRHRRLSQSDTSRADSPRSGPPRLPSGDRTTADRRSTSPPPSAVPTHTTPSSPQRPRDTSRHATPFPPASASRSRRESWCRRCAATSESARPETTLSGRQSGTRSHRSRTRAATPPGPARQQTAPSPTATSPFPSRAPDRRRAQGLVPDRADAPRSPSLSHGSAETGCRPRPTHADQPGPQDGPPQTPPQRQRVRGQPQSRGSRLPQGRDFDGASRWPDRPLRPRRPRSERWASAAHPATRPPAWPARSARCHRPPPASAAPLA